MSRPLRLEFEGALYHVTSRGDRREPIFEDDADREAWLVVVGQGLERFDATAFAYCLMGNHFHLVVQTRQPNLSRLMRQINGVYTQRYNRRHAKVGHLFQGRFKAVVVDEEAYFLEVCRYVDLNPVRAKMAKRPQDWPWSSYRAHTGRVTSPAWLDSPALHRRLAPRAPRRDGPDAYARFVAQGRGVKLWDEALAGQIFLGGEAFVKRMQARIGVVSEHEIPRAQRRPAARALEQYFKGAQRDVAIMRAYLDGGHTQTAIARATGLSVSRISRLIASQEAKGKT
ncbi:MAG: transposase [Betaproteobacteria bacterium]|nr:transposase [Betaproteobacteria bacterium]